jgi:periplasmic divalent cation tolerance protein
LFDERIRSNHDDDRNAARRGADCLGAGVAPSGWVRSDFRADFQHVSLARQSLKTSRAQLAAIQKLLNEIHPYEVPEIIATPIVDGSDAYLKWLGEQLGG